VVYENLKASFPARSEKEVKSLASDFYNYLLTVAAETISSYGMSLEKLQERGEVQGLEEVNAYNQQGQPVLFLLGHCANWEWANFICGSRTVFPSDPVYKQIKNKGMERFMLELRGKQGVVPIEKDMLPREMVRRRKGNRNVGMLADQLPAPGTEKIWIDFLGRPTAFYKGPGQLAAFTGWPVFYIHFERMGKWRYLGEYVKLSDGSKDAMEINSAYAKALERNIRKRPAHWLWSHKRWKYPKEES
jgi:KDO2-lipid IV(A) lauroyltransferase